MEDILKNVMDYYKENISKEIESQGLKAKGWWALLGYLAGGLLLGGATVALIDIAYFKITKDTDSLKTEAIVFVISFIVMIIGWAISMYRANTKNESEINRRQLLKKLRYNLWKKAIEKYVETDNKKEFFSCLLKVHAEGTKKRRVIVAILDWIITGLLIVNSLPGFEEIKSSNMLVIIGWFVFLLFCNMIVNKFIEVVEEKVLKDNYYLQGLIDDYALVVLAKSE